MYVYFIYNNLTGNFKIGKTKNNVEKRIKQLQTGNEIELHAKYIIDDENPEIEKYIHEYYYNKKILNEWFKVNDDEILYIIKLVKYANEIKKLGQENTKYKSDKDVKFINRILKYNPKKKDNEHYISENIVLGIGVFICMLLALRMLGDVIY